jgi:hypothetical protein
MVSIWRFAVTAQHGAGYKSDPVPDPTWYAPIMLVLADLEIDLANICASVPVFWPVLEKHFGDIFITQEIQITREDRWVPVKPTITGSTASHPLVDSADGSREHIYAETASIRGRGEGVYSRADSDAELGTLDPARLHRPESSALKEMGHFGEVSGNVYRMDPMGGSGNTQPSNVLRAGNRGKWWRL